MPAIMMGGATALSAAGSVFSGIMGRSASKKQAEAIRRAQEAAKAGVERYNDKADRQLEPWRTRGDEAGNTLAGLMSGKLNPDDYLKTSSLFKFQQEAGSRDINRQLKARGLYGSGAGLETLQRFENQLVGEEGQRQYDRLFQVSEQGRGAATTMAGNDMNAGGLMANIEMQGGIARGGALAQGDQAFAQGIGGAFSAVGEGGMNYMNFKMLEPLLAKLGGGGKSPMGASASDADMQEAMGRGIVAGTGMPPVSAYAPTVLAPPINDYSMGAMAPASWASSF